jgi:hypothetical protein
VQNPQAGIALADRILTNAANLTPEQQASIAPLVDAARSFKSAVGDAAFNQQQQQTLLQERARGSIPVAGSLDELRMVELLSRLGAARGSAESQSDLAGKGWIDLVTRDAGRSVRITGFDADGRPRKETIVSPASSAPGAESARPLRGFAAAAVPASERSDERRGAPSPATAHATVKLEHAVQQAQQKQVKMIFVPSPAGGAPSASERARDASAAQKFYRDCLESISRAIGGHSQPEGSR